MKNSLLTSTWMRVFCMALAHCATLWLIFAFSSSTLEAATPVGHVMTVGETYSEKVLYRTNEGGTKTYYVDGTSVYSATGTVRLNGLSLANLNNESHFDFSAGKIEVHGKLGDDPNYYPGKKSAKFTQTVKDTLNRTISTQTVSLLWNNTTVTVMVRGTTRPKHELGNTAMHADRYTKRKAGKIYPRISSQVILGPLNCSFGTVTGSCIVTKKVVYGPDVSSGRKVARTLTKAVFKGSGKGKLSRAPARNAVVATLINDTKTVTKNSGGTLNINGGALNGAKVVVPPGAIPLDSEFSLATSTMTTNTNSGEQAGIGIDITTPGSTNFEEPLEITVPIADDNTKVPVPYYVDDNGLLQACQITDIDRENDTMTFETFHASFYTWIYELITGPAPMTDATSFAPATDGFQITNRGSIYNPGGECFGMSAYAQWNFRNFGGGLYPKYMTDIPLGISGDSVKGQKIIATRAHTSLSRLWNSYVPKVVAANGLTGEERYAVIRSVLNNTARPVILYLSDNTSHDGSHAVLAIDHNNSDRLEISDPNYPGQTKIANLSSGELSYNSYQKVCALGDGSFQKEPLGQIYRDAENGFSGNGAAQVRITSHTHEQNVSDRTIVLNGTVTSGQLLVERIEIVLNGSSSFETDVNPSDGSFSIPISLVSGTNELTFKTRGYDISEQLKEAPNTQLEPFKLLYDSSAVVLVTLTWNTDDTDIDLYTIDPTGDYSAYFNKLTNDGGELDYDDTNGFGPEHWTLLNTDTIRWGGDYKVRCHYYSDHQSDGTIPTRWTVNVQLYEGTSRATSQTYSGVLAWDSSSNNTPTGAGADWADVCIVTPVEATASTSTAEFKVAANGVPRITVPIPARYIQKTQKENNEALTREDLGVVK